MADSGGVRAGRAFVEIGANDAALIKGLRAAQQRLASFGASVAKIGAGFAGLGAAILTPMLAATKSFVKTGSELNDMSVRTGASVEALSALKYAAEQTGAGFNDVETGIKKTQKAITDAAGGSKTAVANFTDLGLSVDALVGMNPEQQFEAVAKAIAGIEDPTKRAAAATELWGRGGTKLIPLAIQYDALAAKAVSVGGIMSSAAAGAADTLGDQFSDLSASVMNLANQVGAALAPTILEMTKATTAAIKVIGDWVNEHKVAIVTAAKWAAGILSFGTALATAGTAAIFLSQGIGAVITVMKLVRTATMLLTGATIAQTAANYALATSATTVQAVSGAGTLKVLAGIAVAGIAAGAIQKLAGGYANLKEEIAKATKEMDDANAAMAGTPGAPAADGAPPAPTSDRASNESLRALHEARLKNIDDENNRELNLAIARGEAGIQQAREAGANLETLFTMRKTLALDLGRLEREQAQKKHDEEMKQAKELADLEESRTDTIAALKLESTLKGAGLQRELLALEEQIALRKAAAAGEDLALVREEFDLREEILEKQLAAAGAAVGSAILKNTAGGVDKFGSAGALSASANSQRDQRERKHLQVAEETKRILDDIKLRVREFNQPQVVQI